MRHKSPKRSKSVLRSTKDNFEIPAASNKAKSAADEKVAVALSYSPSDAYSAPEVIATGRGHIAEQLLKLAFEHGVKIHEDADLAEILQSLDIGDEIPVEAFVAVAEILRYIYNNDGVDQEICVHNSKLKKKKNQTICLKDEDCLSNYCSRKMNLCIPEPINNNKLVKVIYL